MSALDSAERPTFRAGRLGRCRVMRKCLLTALIGVLAALGAWAPTHHYHHYRKPAAVSSPQDMYRLSDMYSRADMYGAYDMY